MFLFSTKIKLVFSCFFWFSDAAFSSSSYSSGWLVGLSLLIVSTASSSVWARVCVCVRVRCLLVCGDTTMMTF